MKKLVLTSLATIAALTLAGCTGQDSTTESSNELVVSTFALSEDIVRRDIIEPFEKEEDAHLTLDLGNSADRFTTLVNNPNANIDVIELAQNHSTQGNSDDLFYDITESEVPNIAYLTPGAREVFENDGGVPITVNSIGIIYDPEQVGRSIDSWEDLWAEDLEGRISIPDISVTAGPLFMHVAALHADSNIAEDKGDGAFEALEKLRPNVLRTYQRSSDLANMFSAGEIKVAVVADFAINMIKEAAPGLRYVVPESGTFANFNTINIPKGAQNRELALKFVNYRLSEESQKKKALSLNEGPINTKVELTSEQAETLTYGEVAERAKPVDFRMINENMSSWIDRWNRTMNA